MPLYMDVHRNLDGVTPKDLAEAHLKDVEVQGHYGVQYHQYWLNEETGTVFCLVEGPNKEACDRVHREAHGLVADDLIEVEPTLVQAFMGSAAPNHAGASVTNEGSLDAGFRVVVFTEVANYAEIAEQHGDDVALRIMHVHDGIVRDALQKHHGREVSHTGEGIMSCFSSASTALRFARDIQEKCAAECEQVDGHRPQLRIGIAAGEPVEEHSTLFGISVTTARRICEHAEPGQIMVSATVRELAIGKGFAFAPRGNVQLKGVPEPVSTFSVEAVRPAGAQQPVSVSRKVPLRNFWNELKRRHVVSVGAVYAAVLFAVLQVAQLSFESLGLPEWAYTFLLVIGICGFPLALVLAWLFDLT